MKIHFVGQGDYLLRTSDDAQLTSLATFGIYHDGTFQFSHFSMLFLCIVHEIGYKGTNK